MQFDFITTAVIVSFIWLIVITVFFLISQRRYKQIFQGAEDESAAALLQKIAKEHEGNKHEISALLERVTHLETGSLRAIQKVGLMRFNPFKDTGGDQSFILALLDAQDSGIVVSGLYSRAGTRWYAKKIEQGKGIDHELSEEEKKAIAKAR